MAVLEIFVINLDARPDRLAVVADQLAREGLAYSRIAAFDGRKIDLADVPAYDRDRAVKWYGRELTGGEIGCYISHLQAIDAFLTTDAEFGLVLEDDVVLPEGLAVALPDLIRQLRAVKGGFALANLGYPAKMARLQIGQIAIPNGQVNLFRAFYPALSTHALLWTRAGAAAFRKDCSTVGAPIDDFLRSWGAGTRRILGVSPALVPARAAYDSDIFPGESRAKSSAATSRTPAAERRYQRMMFRAKMKAFVALARARLTG
jgi:glycosyl transferase, family 25